jgi:hypothetical protein
LIPKVSDDLRTGFDITERSSKTYKLNLDKQIIAGFTDSRDAIIQAIYLILNTERYRHIIYSWNYGIELESLFGKPTSYVLPELKRRISEALLQDSRITAVDGFEFEVKRNKVRVTFVVHTIYGDFDVEKTVSI